MDCTKVTKNEVIFDRLDLRPVTLTQRKPNQEKLVEDHFTSKLTFCESITANGKMVTAF